MAAPPVDGHLGRLQALANRQKAAMDSHIQISRGCIPFILVCTYLGVKWPNRTVKLVFRFLRNCQMILQGESAPAI